MRKRFWMSGLVLFMAFIMSACGAEQKRESAKADASTTEQSIAAAELATGESRDRFNDSLWSHGTCPLTLLTL